MRTGKDSFFGSAVGLKKLPLIWLTNWTVHQATNIPDCSAPLPKPEAVKSEDKAL